MSAKIEPLSLEAFPTRIVHTLRYADHDQEGHVNNAVYATMFEAGRVSILYDPARHLPPEGCHFSLVRITIDFLAEMSWPGEIAIGTGVTRIGGSSVGLRHAIFKDGTCRSTADSIVVCTNSTTRKSQPLPDRARAMLEEVLFRRQA
jgi:acyl-CoA thioester hydrolase